MEGNNSVFNWNEDDVCEKLRSEQFDVEVIEAFEREAIDGPALLSLTYADLKELQLKIGHRKRVERFIKSLSIDRRLPEETTSSSFPPAAILPEAFPPAVSPPAAALLIEPSPVCPVASPVVSISQPASSATLFFYEEPQDQPMDRSLISSDYSITNNDRSTAGTDEMATDFDIKDEVVTHLRSLVACEIERIEGEIVSQTLEDPSKEAKFELQYTIPKFVYSLMDNGFSRDYLCKTKMTSRPAVVGVAPKENVMKPCDLRMLIDLTVDAWKDLPQTTLQEIILITRKAVRDKLNNTRSEGKGRPKKILKTEDPLA